MALAIISVFFSTFVEQSAIARIKLFIIIANILHAMAKKLCFAATLFIAAHMQAVEKEYKTYLISTAHFDTQWNWDVKESIEDYLHRTMVQNFWLFERFPDYVFNFEGANKYAWMKEYYPQEYERVKQYIRDGRWNVVGSTWEPNDPNIPTGESFIRNVLYGQEFYKKEFGKKSNDIYLPDCFGFGWTLPTLASHCGLKGFSTQKLQWRKADFYGDGKKMPFPIGVWQGIDGSKILGVLDAGGYGTSYFYDDISQNDRIIKRSQRGPENTSFTYYGVGDRGGSPTLPSVYSMQQTLKEGEGPVELIVTSPCRIYEDFYPFENHPELPEWNGELLMDVHGVGCYTSQTGMKKLNRRNEQLGAAAELASIAGELLGGMSYPEEALRENWQRVIWHQFHDDITGTSIPRSYTYSWNDELIAQRRFADAITHGVGNVARALDTRVDGEPLVVFNPLATGRKEIVYATVSLPASAKGIKVTDERGKTVPSQIISRDGDKADVAFAADVKPASFTVYGIKPTKTSQERSAIMINGNTIENSVYRLTLNGNGDISSIIDKRVGKELVDPSHPFSLVVFTDNVSPDYPAWELYKKVLDGPREEINDSVSISIADNGPVKGSLKVTRRWKDSEFTQFVSLTEGGADDIIEIDNCFDWYGKKALLKAEFPTTVSAPMASYDLGHGYVKRGNNEDKSFEVLGHKWADLSSPDGSFGITILNDCKYGWDKPDDNTIRLTLLHTPEAGQHYRYQDHQDHGRNTFRYGIAGHMADEVASDAAAKGDAFNQPMLVFTTERHSGKLGRQWSLLDVDGKNIEVKAFKKAEDGNGYILRVAERHGKDFNDASVTMPASILSAEEVNGIEEPIGDASFSGNTLTFDGTAFAPKSFRLTLASDPCLKPADNLPVDLPVNAVGLTVDEFNKAGVFDRAGNSFPAELMPAVVEADGISFDMKNDPALFNFVRCNGDTIDLPAHKGKTRLFILATSADRDRIATFTVDGREHTFEVPYFSGFYGQWGWPGESESYMKHAPIGYIANHKHSAPKGNDAYSFACLYKLCIDIDEDARQLILPADAGIAVFSATLSDAPAYSTLPATEMMTLPPVESAHVEYVTEPVKYWNERSLW